MKKVEPLELRKKWNDYLDWLVDKVERFPQKHKYVLGQRILNTALDVLEQIIVIRYSSREEKSKKLPAFNLKLEVFRELMRIAWRKKIISDRSFLFQEYQTDQVGRMMHGLVVGNIKIRK